MGSHQRVGAINFEVTVGDLTFQASKVSLGIEDSVAVAKDNGIPNGWVSGEVSAEGEMELDAQAMAILAEAAKSAGSWRELPEFDLLFFAKVASGEEMKVEAFGVKLKLEGLLDIDKNKGGEKHITKLKFVVTSPDFVHINGVPYLGKDETTGIIRPGE